MADLQIRVISISARLICGAIAVICLSGRTYGDDLHQADEPLPPEQAAKTMIVPEGFQVTLFAGEPDVKQPIGFCIDDRGRLWVAEAYNYPHHGDKPGDRILIFEDEDGDGKFDRRTVFYDQLNYVTGIEVGFGGVWVMSPPSFYFIPDRNHDDIPDEEPTVLLDGFGNHANAHNLANGLAWGPDGWLYGTHGRTNWSLLGKPGTPKEERTRFDGGVYRYHPVTHQWEPYADGTTNPWGIDWNDYGDAFICNCVNPHLFQVIPGAHYEPWRNRRSSQYAYERIPTIADHLHFVGTRNVRDGLGSHQEDEAGGGHAHCGTMIYLGDNWPKKYRNSIFMNNIHGRRINNDLLRRTGSGYTASHGKDVMLSRDPWYMGVTLAYGPDGSVFASDWSDTGECHSTRNTRRHTGRIYKIHYGSLNAFQGDVSKLSNAELVQLQLHENDWFVRHARRVLQERTANGDDMQTVHEDLRKLFTKQQGIPQKLRMLWALYVTEGLSDELLDELLQHESEYLRGWAVRLLCEDKKVSEKSLESFQQLASSGTSPYVRLQLASCLQRLPLEDRWALGRALLSRGEDNSDQNLPLMIWYGVEPLVGRDVSRFVGLLSECRMDVVRNHIARRVAELDENRAGINALIEWLKTNQDANARNDVLAGLLKGLEGVRRFPMPAEWPSVFSTLVRRNEATRQNAIRLAFIFEDPSAAVLLKRIALDNTESPRARKDALETLVGRTPKDLPPLLWNLTRDADLQVSALQGLAAYNDDDIPVKILKDYGDYPANAKQTALQTLASRKMWASQLMDAIETKTIPASDLDAYTARQIESLADPKITARLKSHWGTLRQTPQAKLKQIQSLKRHLTREIAEADRVNGRLLFRKNCANCHRLFDDGGKIGPDLTGAQRTNLDYLLENIIDPSGSVAKDYQMEKIATDSGRTLTGMVISETDRAIVLQTIDAQVTVPKTEIELREKSSLSMMPDGLLEKLSEEEIRDLVGYLSGVQQVPLPPSNN